MMRFVLIAMLLLVAPAVAAQEALVPDPIETATGFVDLLARHDFASAEPRMTAVMRQVLPADKLGETWSGVEAQAGAFGARLGTTVSPVGRSHVVAVTCRFARAHLDIRVTVDPDGLVSGLFFVPTPVPWTPPAYADTTAFRHEDVTVGTGPLALPGTLTVPNGAGPFPAIVLVHGSGPNDRDESVGGTKVFRDLAEGLSSRGIIVLRYEKRTRAHPVAFMGSFTVDDEATDDAVAAVALLHTRADVDRARIFVAGHSLGGMLAPRIAQRATGLAGLVILAGTARPLEDVMLEQADYLDSLPENQNDAARAQLEAIRSGVPHIRALTPADSASTTPIIGAPARYWLDLRTYHPAAVARTLDLPMLFLQGGRDYQVTTADFDTWRQALAGRPRVTFRLLPDLNHLFVTGTGRSHPSEYAAQAHVSGTVIDAIAEWISRLPATPRP